jgi:hypothetical protein
LVVSSGSLVRRDQVDSRESVIGALHDVLDAETGLQLGLRARAGECGLRSAWGECADLRCRRVSLGRVEQGLSEGQGALHRSVQFWLNPLVQTSLLALKYDRLPTFV